MPRFGRLVVAAIASVSATALPFCSTAQLDAVVTQTKTSESFAPCMDDTNTTDGRISSTQLTLARDSDNCQWLFGDFQTAALAANHSCIELALATTATFEQFLTYLEIKATSPSTPTPCNTSQVRDTFTKVIANSNHSDCLNASGLNASTAFDHFPSLNQLAVLRTTDQCAGLFIDLQRATSTLPICTMFEEGTPVQAIAYLSLDDAVSWLELLAPYLVTWTQTTESSAIEFPRSHMQHGAGVLLAAMLAGTGVIFGVYVLYSNHRLPAVVVPVEEELRLLVLDN